MNRWGILFAYATLGTAPLLAFGGAFEDGIAALKNNDNATAAKHFHEAAQSANSDAQYNLGFLYANGLGVAKDDDTAVRWYRMAAEQGHAGAQSNLAYMIGAGRGAKLDDAEAVSWYQKAAEQGEPSAQVSLGMRHLTGRGVPQDQAKAVYWLQLAGVQGHPVAKQVLRDLFGKANNQMAPNEPTGMSGMR